jgi:hypothetical protein
LPSHSMGRFVEYSELTLCISAEWGQTIKVPCARRSIELTQPALLDWLRVEYAIEKPSNKHLAVAELDSDTWVGAGSVGDGDRCLKNLPSPIGEFFGYCERTQNRSNLVRFSIEADHSCSR